MTGRPQLPIIEGKAESERNQGTLGEFNCYRSGEGDVTVSQLRGAGSILGKNCCIQAVYAGATCCVKFGAKEIEGLAPQPRRV